MKNHQIPSEIKLFLTEEKLKKFVGEVKEKYNQTENLTDLQLDYMGLNMAWVESFQNVFNDNKIMLDYYEKCDWEEADNFSYEVNLLLLKYNLIDKIED